MKKENKNDFNKLVLALGMFDGVHIGHRKLILAAVDMARELGAAACTYTFMNHPSSIFGSPVPLIMSNEDRQRSIEELGAGTYFEDFTKLMSLRSPEEFLDALMEKFNICGMVCGFDYRFGKDRIGDGEYLSGFGAERGIKVEVVPAVEYEGRPVSSTWIRELIAQGDLGIAKTLLGRNISYSGIVKKNLGIGSGIGYATANLVPKGVVLPPLGVYATRTKTQYGTFDSVTNIGIRPTVGRDEDAPTIETHLLGCDLELYEQRISVELLGFIRAEIRFASLEELSVQIEKDIANTQQTLKNLA